jgi:type VI protein secretion system component Hcp
MFTQFRRKWSDRFVSGRLYARRRGQERGHRARVQLEVLEDRTVFSTALGITFDAGAGPLPELAIQSYSWGAQGGTIPRVQDFTMTLAPGSVEPGLWGHLAANTHVNSAVIHVRNGGGLEYATYTLTDVLISSFTTGEASGGTPQDTISLHFGKVAESYSPINSDGSLGSADKASYEQEPQRR